MPFDNFIRLFFNTKLPDHMCSTCWECACYDGSVPNHWTGDENERKVTLHIVSSACCLIVKCMSIGSINRLFLIKFVESSLELHTIQPWNITIRACCKHCSHVIILTVSLGRLELSVVCHIWQQPTCSTWESQCWLSDMHLYIIQSCQCSLYYMLWI